MDEMGRQGTGCASVPQSYAQLSRVIPGVSSRVIAVIFQVHTLRPGLGFRKLSQPSVQRIWKRRALIPMFHGTGIWLCPFRSRVQHD
jgi:hypothetical protein